MTAAAEAEEISQPANDDLTAEPVFADDIVAFVTPGDPRLANAPLSPPALDGQQFVMREEGSATRELAERCLRSAGCSPGHIVELGSNEAVKRAVEAGLGIGLLSTHAIEAERIAELLVDLPLRPWSCHRSFWLVVRRDRTLTRAEQAFLGLNRAGSTRPG
jgi:DNA-binding transcriptional LysR family regulator